MAGKKVVKREIKLLKPEHLDIDKLLDDNRDAWTLKRIEKRKLEFIIDAILRSRISNRKEMEDKNLKHTPVCAEIVQRVVDNYKDYFKFLIDNQIVISDGQYVKGEKCTGYAFNEPYNSQRLIEYDVTDHRIKKSVKRELMRRDKEWAATTIGYKYLTQHWKTDKLDINVEGAFKCIEALIEQKIQAIPVSYSKRIRGEKEARIRAVEQDFKQHVLRIEAKDYNYRFSGLCHRFFNPISNLKRELRNFLSYNGETLGDIDISNSQPFMSLALFNPEFWSNKTSSKKEQLYFKDILPSIYKYLINNKTIKNNINSFIMLSNSSINQYSIEFQRFKDLVLTGKFYDYIKEHFEPHFPKSFDTRQKVKKQVLIMLFSDPLKHDTPGFEPCLMFKKHFPVIYKLFTSIQTLGKNFLSTMLQRIESFLIIDVVCKQISLLHPDIFYVTIHDNIITPKKNEAVVREIMRSEIEKWIGYVPPIDSKDLLPSNINLAAIGEQLTQKPTPHKVAIEPMLFNKEMEPVETNSFQLLETMGTWRMAKAVVDTCTGEEFANEKEAAIIKSIDYDTLIIYLNSEENPTCLRYKAA